MTRVIAIALLALGYTAAASHAQNYTLPELDDNSSKAMVDLGRLLFFDPRLSGDGSTSCADCHDPNFGFGDGAELSRGYPGTKHWRNSQTLVNSAYLKNGLHWDGTVPSLLDQVPGAMGTPFTANIDVPLAEERLRQIPEYTMAFNEIWGEAPNITRIAEAISAYEHSLISADSPFDRFAGGDVEALSEEALRGLVLFNGKANCSSCHSGPLMTDESFHNTSVPASPIFQEDPLVQVTFRLVMRGFGVSPEVSSTLDRDPGYYVATKNADDMGTFRTPPLRYLKYTAPYMHNGAFYTLGEVVSFYNSGGTEDVFGTKSDKIKPLGLSQQEQDDLVAFLESMSGTEIREEYPLLPQYAVLPMGEVRTSGRISTIVPVETETTARAMPTESGIQSDGGGLVIGAQSGGSDLAANVDGRTIQVQPGDTLGGIAKREYGDVLRYIDILEANSDVIEDPNNLRAGIRLLIP